MNFNESNTVEQMILDALPGALAIVRNHKELLC
jgi:hypothetical protein